MATLALTGTVVSLQQTLVLPLLPDLPGLLNTTADNASWLVTATLLFGAVSMPTVTRLADMFGKKRMMMVALAIMVLGSVLGAVSTDLILIIIARALQGVGLSLMTVGIAILRDELPRDRVAPGALDVFPELQRLRGQPNILHVSLSIDSDTELAAA
ncbi:MFS transporter [Nocardia sp. NPDC050799]|uniref:MFS transporter n=1 Tax=Nocardia sp. NPDC050799 TaxID=3154842 RepID=UPI0033FEEDEF